MLVTFIQSLPGSLVNAFLTYHSVVKSKGESRLKNAIPSAFCIDVAFQAVRDFLVLSMGFTVAAGLQASPNLAELKSKPGRQWNERARQSRYFAAVTLFSVVPKIISADRTGWRIRPEFGRDIRVLSQDGFLG
ncbi:hypothetical protein [Marinobacter sp. F3R08]|uniref:hypothetical protein n=1 Tax=Marinobacter sp. F3R08 TaxID=2841559 RepID=UPI001C0A656F|nr:hypothetical protein [Marinobacter sp. F3R08]MBU2952190.1 hypothetical protein [Marinobacter sp. F3R08]